MVEELLKLNESIHMSLDSMMMNRFFLKEKLTIVLTPYVMQGPAEHGGEPGSEGSQGEKGDTSKTAFYIK